MIEHRTNEQAEEVAKTQLEVAQLEEQWMMAVWSIKNGEIKVQETTCNYPRADHNLSLVLLKRLLDQKEAKAPVEPLPLAPHLVNEGLNTEKEVKSVPQSELTEMLEDQDVDSTDSSK